MRSSIHPFCPPEIPLPEPERKAADQPETIVPFVDAPLDAPISFRAYAAVHLRVADSGIDWLDDMIRRSRELDRMK